MKNTTLVMILITLAPFLKSQSAIHGVVYDAITKAKIEGVSISPVFFGDSTTTDFAGRFKKYVPKDYHGALTFSRTDYYPFKQPIGKGSRMHPHLIYLYPRKFTLDTLLFLDDQNNERIRVKVIESGTLEPVATAAIRLKTNQTIAYTDYEGYAWVILPKTTEIITVKHEEYYEKEMSIRFKGPRKPAPTFVLERKVYNAADTAWKKQKNVISLAPLELISCALAIRYERFLKPKQSIGVHSSMYFYGRNVSSMGSEYNYYPVYQGVKLSPFYRFYPVRNKRRGLFAEVKFPFGYIHFSELDYHYTSSTHPRVKLEYSFWTSGFGASVGVMLKMPKTEYGVINISVGYQYFPIDVPETIQYPLHDKDGTVLTLPTDTSWWYWGGPGTSFDLKFTLGGIF